ncbi:MAG TPA: thioredoxin domain-containing protein [Acidobacteriaceae bacterium]|jgi:protein-disulfide isomerase
MYRYLFLSSLLTLSLAASAVSAQTQVPAAPAPQQAPTAPAPSLEPKEVHFPPVEASNFSAASPTKEEVEAFLKTSWGYDSNRVWEVYAVQNTNAPGVSKVIVLVAEKQNPKQIANLTFFVTPDGKHLISQEAVMDFGARPYENNYRILQQRATGPSRGATGKQFELVEFADFECPHCKEAQPVVEKLLQDFPQAHYVFETFPLVNVHPMAFKAAAFGECVNQQGGNDAFFKYADAIFTAQGELAGQGAEQALRNSVTAAGSDPNKVAACADSAAGKAPVEATLRLAQDLNVNETPTLFIDGRAVPMLAVPYAQLKMIIEYQFALDKAQ